MPYTILGKNAMLDALAAVATHCGLFTKTEITAVTGANATDLLTKTSHGLSNGDVFAQGVFQQYGHILLRFNEQLLTPRIQDEGLLVPTITEEQFTT